MPLLSAEAYQLFFGPAKSFAQIAQARLHLLHFPVGLAPSSRLSRRVSLRACEFCPADAKGFCCDCASIGCEKDKSNCATRLTNTLWDSVRDGIALGTRFVGIVNFSNLLKAHVITSGLRSAPIKSFLCRRQVQQIRHSPNGQLRRMHLPCHSARMCSQTVLFNRPLGSLRHCDWTSVWHRRSAIAVSGY